MAKVRVPIFGSLCKAVTIDPTANRGAQIGVDLFMPDGSVATIAGLAELLSSDSPPETLPTTLWRLIGEIPANIGGVAALSTVGLAVRQTGGSWITRAIATGSSKITVANGDGDAGAPTIDVDQAQLSIAETQIPDGSILARLAANEVITGAWRVQNAAGWVIAAVDNADRVSFTYTDIGTDDFEFLIDPAYTGDSAVMRIGDFDQIQWDSFTTSLFLKHLGSATNSVEIRTTPGDGGITDLLLDADGNVGRINLSGFSELTAETVATFFESVEADEFHVDGGLENYADDAAAATGGIAINQLYRNGSVVMIRVS